MGGCPTADEQFMMLQPIVKRPPTTIAPREGLMRAEHFQVAYVTSDIQRACAVMRERYGVEAFFGMDAPCHGGSMHVELAWVGGVMIELIQAQGPGTEFYTDRLPKDRFAIRHHHYGYLVPDLDAWDSLKANVERGGWPIVFENHVEGLLRFFYVEAGDLGHYLEYFLLEPGGVALFEGIPAS